MISLHVIAVLLSLIVIANLVSGLVCLYRSISNYLYEARAGGNLLVCRRDIPRLTLYILLLIRAEDVRLKSSYFNSVVKERSKPFTEIYESKVREQRDAKKKAAAVMPTLVLSMCNEMGLNVRLASRTVNCIGDRVLGSATDFRNANTIRERIKYYIDEAIREGKIKDD